MNDNNPVSTRQQLILAGLQELQQSGIEHFSTRRVAKACGLSCAAPYKHFKDTQTFISEIFGYVEQEFLKKQAQVLRDHADASTREKLIAVSLSYLAFLTEHPSFRSVVMMLMRDCSEEYRCLRGQMSLATTQLVDAYCDEVQMPADVRKRKLFLVRSLIYSAAMFFESGELAYSQENIHMVSSLMAREFDLP